MSEPTREHVEAVGAGVRDCIKRLTTPPVFPGQPSFGATEFDIARAVLTSTDPAVLDAMQDALVRAGRLAEEIVWRELPDQSWQERRLVSEWTEAGVN